MKMIDAEGPHYYVVFQSPGPKWVAGTPYNEQPGFMDHANYVSGLHDKGLVVLSGPFMKEEGGLNGKLEDGGFTILKVDSLAEATKIGTEDPTVQSGLLNAEIKTLWVPFH
jgi:uncharacterized protein YciI